MNPSISLGELKYYLIPGEGVSSDYIAIYNEAYRMWKAVWSETLAELDGNKRIYSDDFSRQTHLGALFLKDRCVAMTAFHEVDFRLDSTWDDSYFQVWPFETMERLRGGQHKVMICSHLTVDKAYRGSVAPGLTLKALIASLSTRHLMDSDFPVMTGTMRCDKGVHKTTYDLGAEPLAQGVIMHGVPVDLVALRQEPITNHHQTQPQTWVETLWQNRVVIDRKLSATQRNAA